MSQGNIPEAELERVRTQAEAIRAEIAKAYIGEATTIQILLTALLAQGHVLIEGVPGVV